LATRIGYPASWWPEVAVKELIDNAIDDAETHDQPPVIGVTIEDMAIIIEDHGSGIAPDIVARIFDYDRQTSSREAFIEPTRGAQGNALQTILAMPVVICGSRGEIVIESCRVRHDLSFTVDPVLGSPVIGHERSPSDVASGTRVTVKWPVSLENDDRASLGWLAQKFSCFNPHLEITIKGREISATDRAEEVQA
jgi:DNA topoisomerase VI subunit B